MKKLIYEISITAPKEKVWQTLIEKDSYDKWVQAFSPHSTYRGEWKEGNEMIFWDPNMGGTTAVLEVFRPHESIVAKHINTITKEGIAETTGEMTEKWIGTQETYHLSESNGETTLTISMSTDEVFRDMFDRCWPKALDGIKHLCEV